MTEKERRNNLRDFLKTTTATTTVLIELIHDLAPVIGYNEANRLMSILAKENERSEEE